MPSRDKRQKIPFIVSIVALVPATAQAFMDQDFVVAWISAAILVANVVALKWNHRHPVAIHVCVNLSNSVLAFYLAHSLHAKGTQGIHYVWAIAGLFFLLATFVPFFRRSSAESES